MLGHENYCVVMAGGFGTRLWPLSRKGMPKQFLNFNNNGHTLLRETVDRMKLIFPEENIIVSTNLDFYDDVCRLLPEINPLQVLREPVMKGTAPSIMLASYHIRDINPNANILFVPSDLVIIDEKPYVDVLERGMAFVKDSRSILTVGIKPTRPETRFGYIQINDELTDGIYSVRTFTEKPEESFAKIFVDSGEFYWNSGILMWNANAFIDIAKTCLPDMVSQFNYIFNTMHSRDDRRGLLYSVYEAFPRISIDYGILERTDQVCMAMGDFRFNDIESWDLLYDYCAKDSSGNVLGMYNYQVYNCRDSMFLCNKENKLVVIDDLSDFLVVDTDDVLVICRRNNETDFKRYINDAMLKYGDKYS
ncbi:MAG: mannose-1-phosphate guanylyltransferase [Bacteroidaceae bacterium]|nr:mannose-1-phosphate guanylyltransferase [Bacteroidaceae bacterium]